MSQLPATNHALFLMCKVMCRLDESGWSAADNKAANVVYDSRYDQLRV